MIRSLNISALLAVICWATMGPFAKYAFDYFPSDAYLGLRPLIAAIGGFAALLIRGKSVRISRASLPRFFLCGAIGFALTQTTYVKSLDMTSVSHHAVLISTTPLLAAIVMPAFQRRRPHGLVLFGSLLGFVGVAMLVSGAGSEGSTVAGDLLALASAVIWIGVVVWPLPLMARYDVEVANAWLFAMSLIVIIPITSPALVDVARNPPNWIAWAAVIYGGLIGILLGNILWFKAIQQSGVDRILVYQYLPPVLTLAMALVFLGERITLGQAIGSVLILGGVVIVQRSAERKPLAEPV